MLTITKTLGEPQGGSPTLTSPEERPSAPRCPPGPLPLPSPAASPSSSLCRPDAAHICRCTAWAGFGTQLQGFLSWGPLPLEIAPSGRSPEGSVQGLYLDHLVFGIWTFIYLLAPWDVAWVLSLVDAVLHNVSVVKFSVPWEQFFLQSCRLYWWELHVRCSSVLVFVRNIRQKGLVKKPNKHFAHLVG